MTERSASIALKPAAPSASGLRLQRKCACGTHAAGGECASCSRERLQRKPTPGGRASEIPASVHAVLQSTGAPLQRAARSCMESGFGHDFSRVRVHDGAAAARSASDMQAAAYTVGAHIVFGAGRYAPDTAAGRHLLAHELAHVVQQRGGDVGVMRKSISSLVIGDEHDAAERDADRAADRITQGRKASIAVQADATLPRAPRHTPAIVGLDPSGPDADLSGKTEDTLWQCMRGTVGIPSECPQAPLTWADFRTVGGGGGFGANTGWDVKDKPMAANVAACVRRVLGWSQDQTHVFQATFVRRSAWVRRQFAHPTDVAATGCQGPVRQCERNFSRRRPRGQIAGDFTFSAGGGGTCPASIAPATVTAKSAGDCHLIGEECTRTAVAESARLLRHEQGHMDIACAMARKFNMAIANGTPFAQLNRNPGAFIQRVQDRYDAQTQHGCLAGPQAAWEAEIGSGLPKEALPQPVPATRPRRRRR